MRGGDRRSLPITRRMPHFKATLARANANYQAVNRGSNGKFTSCPNEQNVQKLITAINEQGNRSLEEPSASMEEEVQHTLESMEAQDGDEIMAGSCEQQTLDSRGIEHEIAGIGELVVCDLQSSSIPTPSPTFYTAGANINGRVGSSSNINCIAAICRNDSMKNFAVGQQTTSFIGRGSSGLLSSSIPMPQPASMGAGDNINEVDMMWPSSNNNSNAVVCNPDSRKFNNDAGISVWNKPGVTPLPTLKELPHLTPKEGVVQLDKEVEFYISRFEGALVG